MIFADEPTGALNRGASEEVMRMLTRLNAQGTTIMLVTHDIRVAANCSRIFYIEDGNIRGELSLGKTDVQALSLKERERKANTWLTDMGW